MRTKAERGKFKRKLLQTFFNSQTRANKVTFTDLSLIEQLLDEF